MFIRPDIHQPADLAVGVNFDHGDARTVGHYTGSVSLVNSPPISRTITLNGSTQYAQISDESMFSIPTNGGLTVMAWIKPDTLPASAVGQRMWIATKGRSSNYEWAMSINGYFGGFGKISSVRWKFDGGKSNERYSSTSAQAGVWQHVGFRVNSNSSTEMPDFFYNGSPDNGGVQGIDNPSNTNGTSEVRIGYIRQGFERRFDGEIDDVRIYRRPLSDAEFGQIFQETVNEHPI